MSENKQQPYISVTVTSYNYGRYIRRQLDSIAAQTFRDFEIVISDDCSTDDSVSVIRGFIHDHPELSVTFIEGKENLGLSENRNVVLDHAKGTYIMFCDSDDWLDPDCLEVLAAKAKETDADRVVSFVRDVNEKGEVLQVQTEYGTMATKWMCGLHHGSIYKRSVFTEHGIRFNPAGAAEDFYLTAAFHSVCGPVAFVPRPTYNWFIHSDSTSGAKKEISSLTGINMLYKTLKAVRRIYVGLKRDKRRTEDKDLFLYQILKIYCVCIYHNYQRIPLRDTLRAYRKMQEIMARFEPDYRRNPYINLKGISPARRYAQIIIWGTMWLERLHLMPLALTAYHFVAKFHYFNI